MIVFMGCSNILFGHSKYHRAAPLGKMNERFNAALRGCLDQPKLRVVLCIGKTTLKRHKDGPSEEGVVDVQIQRGLQEVGADVLLGERVLVPYKSSQA